MNPRPRRSRVVAARRAAHRTSVTLGDVRAVQTGRVPRRIANRLAGRGLAALLRGRWL